MLSAIALGEFDKYFHFFQTCSGMKRTHFLAGITSVDYLDLKNFCLFDGGCGLCEGQRSSVAARGNVCHVTG